MSKWVEIDFQDRKFLINKEKICWVEWSEINQVQRLIIHMSYEHQGIPVPVDQSLTVLEEIKEFWQ
ncbi:hypothetical protein [Calothrix rhizosoleniae]|uniref:hypothetical protein n=1 Tax=Calothrix rhizosoleniae TaxID=888997 RepID=UPI0011785FA9|nr:hypothetical protein [Calothrix rhizosoleniae]